jgi:alkylation response protein AidB-like acyl-CoA dehydrogenase
LSTDLATGLYEIPQEMVDFRETIRRIATEKIAPRAGEIDREAKYPWDIRRILGEQDILGLPFDEEYGGTGTGTLMLQIGVEEIAKACASSALILMIQELGTLPIQLFGSGEQKQRFLPRCASGEWSPAFALSEPEAGSDPASMRTTAVKEGDEWVINGQKCWITNAGVADFYVVFATTDRENRRISAFIVEKEREGFDPASSSTSSGSRARRPARPPSPTSACRMRT